MKSHPTNQELQLSLLNVVSEAIHRHAHVDKRLVANNIAEMQAEIISQVMDLIAKHDQQLLARLKEKWPEHAAVELGEPSLYQGSGGDSAPFFCSLCGMSELNIMSRKEDDRYYCHCSYWTDPHNAYVDRSGGKWLGWFDKDAAQKTVDSMPTEENGRNKALKEAWLVVESILDEAK